MENNPINTNSFQHFLEIRGVEHEIIEPNNSDKSNFRIIQDEIARDTFLANEEIALEFLKDYEGETDTFINNDGVLISNLRSGYFLLSQENNDFGNEADVKYIIKKNGISFIIGNVDFNKDFETDGISYINCRIIQNTNQALIKKRDDISINLLSDKDLDDNTIDAIPLQKMFLKAKPIYGESEWEKSRQIYAIAGLGIFLLSPFQIVKKYGINNTLSFLSPIASAFSYVPFSGFSLIQAENELTQVTIDIDLKFTTFSHPLPRLRISSGSYDGVTLSLSNNIFIDIQSVLGFYENKLHVLLPNPVLAGERIELFFDLIAPPIVVGFDVANVKMSAIETSVSSVVYAVRQIDAIKQTYKAIGSLPVDAEKYDVNGEFYDNFLFNKNLIKQNIEAPFYTKLKDIKEDLLEQCAYAQVNKDKIYIGQFNDFYQNVEIGAFLEVPDSDSKFSKNLKYLVNKFVFGYEKYEQDRTTKNTIDAIHTDSQWYVQALNSINTKELKLPFIRDPFNLEIARKLIFSNQETSTNDDDNVFKVDVVRLAPNSRNKFTRLLTWSADGTAGTTKTLSDNSFRWDLLGFKVGDVIKENGLNKTVLEITPTILTLSYSGGTATGSNLITYDYPLTDVLFVNRTNEGLILAENLTNSDNFSNLRYSIKRNMRHWFSVLATYGKFIPNKKIKNTYFKANGECKTQFLGETLPITENEDILINDITENKIINQDIYSTIVKCSFEDAVELTNKIQEERGFVRVQNPKGGIIKGYIKDANYEIQLEELSLELEIKNESDFLKIDFIDGEFKINEVGYDEKTTNVKNYNIFNNYIQFFDNNSINLCNRTKFDKVLLNGISYNNVNELINAIELL